ncbi:hypothetical protein ACIHCQ_21910 [Streptomyces sp. NPDC052236]|uniref:hypothetical protein n=1 Tax=Streptomyces sp. NPDC052236 TaxID=3365686 RepID=UPI0037CEC3F5
MKKKIAALSTTMCSLALAISISSPAQAVEPEYRDCETTGAQGDVVIKNWHGPGTTVTITISVADLAADNRQVRVRFISKNTHGSIKYWPWRANNDGSGTRKTWTTTASDSAGIFDGGVQVGRFSGSTMVNNCAAWT